MNNNNDINAKLLDACIAEKADFGLVEELVDKGADPLETFNEYGDTVLDELFCLASSEEMPILDKRVPELVYLFIKNGMDINKVSDNPDDDIVSPLWSMAFWCTPNAIKTLKILLDNGLKAPVLDQFLDHFVSDAAYVSGDISGDDYHDYLVCGFKMIMMSASYDKVLASSDYLKELIGTNSYN